MTTAEMTLEEVRSKAKERLKGVCMVYKDCNGDPTKFCQGQHYGRKLGIGGIGSGASFYNNWKALRQISLKMALMGEITPPDTTFNFFGKSLSMPIMAASVSGVNSFGGETVITEQAFCEDVIKGCIDAGTLGWRGDTHTYTLENDFGINAIAKYQNGGVKIIKPRSQEVILDFIKKTEAAKATAVGVDIDGCGSYMMNKHRQPVFRKTEAEIKELTAATRLPFIVKGVMGVADARMAVSAGASAIVVSNHGGRVLDHTPGTADVLPAIAAAVRNAGVMLLVDGGIRTGYDVLKMLALGADAVLIGRDIIRASVGGGAKGVFLQMDCLRSSFEKAMLMTGCQTLEDIGPDILV